jgi:hypothetical protein
VKKGGGRDLHGQLPSEPETCFCNVDDLVAAFADHGLDHVQSEAFSSVTEGGIASSVLSTMASTTPRANGEFIGPMRLAAGNKCGDFLVSDTNPIDLSVSADDIGRSYPILGGYIIATFGFRHTHDQSASAAAQCSVSR